MEYALCILKKLGYKDNEINKVHDYQYSPYPIPDFIINHKGIRIAVEVGMLSRKNKIKDLLRKFEIVYWIMVDKEFPMINCIKFCRKQIIIEKTKEELNKELEIEKNRQEMIKELKELV
jgi:hypothetical protein